MQHSYTNSRTKPGRQIDKMESEPVCVHAITFEPRELRPRYLARCLVLILSRASSKVKVMGQSSRSHDENVYFSATDARCDVTYFWFFCGVLCAKVTGATSSKSCLVHCRIMSRLLMYIVLEIISHLNQLWARCSNPR